MTISAELAETRADLFAVLAQIPDVTVYGHEPDAADLPAIWVDQPNAARADPATTVAVGWDVVVVVDVAAATDVTDQLDALICVVVDNVAKGVAGVRFDQWTRGTRPVGGVNVPAATVSWLSLHVIC